MTQESKGKKLFQLKQYSNRIELKSQLIEIKIPKNTVATVKTKIQFPDEQNLRNSHLMGMEVFHFADIPQSIVTKQTVVDIDVLKTIFITLQDYNGYNFALQDPAITYHNNGTVVENFPMVFAGQKMNYPKSYIEIADVSKLSVDEDQVLPIRVFYRLFDEVEKAMRQASFRKQK
jgi:hypothetical protein